MTTEVGFERDVEHLDKDCAHIMAQPFFENVHQELAILLAVYGALGDEVAILGIEQALATGLVTPTLVGDIDGFGAGALDDGDELNPGCFHFIAKEAIDRAAMVFVGGVDGAQDVEVHFVLAQVSPALHDLVEGASFAAVEAVGVVDFAGAIDAEAHQKVVFLEESAPFVIEQDAVGLKSVLHDLVRTAVFLHEFDGAAEELDLHEGRLAALPSHSDVRSAVRFQQLADVGLERGLGHPILFVGIERFLGEEEAVRAIDIASGSARFREEVKGRGRLSGPSLISD